MVSRPDQFCLNLTQQLLGNNIPNSRETTGWSDVSEVQDASQHLHDAGLLEYGIVMWSQFAAEAKS